MKLAIILCLVPTLAFADKIKMKTGLWEMTGDMEMGGMKMPSKIQHCVTDKDLDGSWFKQLPPGADCEADQIVTSSSVSWRLDCKMGDGAGKMKSKGKVSYTKTSFHGSATMEMTIPHAGKQTGRATMSGKYLGACKK